MLRSKLVAVALVSLAAAPAAALAPSEWDPSWYTACPATCVTSIDDVENQISVDVVGRRLSAAQLPAGGLRISFAPGATVELHKANGAYEGVVSVANALSVDVLADGVRLQFQDGDAVTARIYPRQMVITRENAGALVQRVKIQGTGSVRFEGSEAPVLVDAVGGTLTAPSRAVAKVVPTKTGLKTEWITSFTSSAAPMLTLSRTSEGWLETQHGPFAFTFMDYANGATLVIAGSTVANATGGTINVY